MSNTQVKAQIEMFTDILNDDRIGRAQMNDEQIKSMEDQIEKLSTMTDAQLDAEVEALHLKNFKKTTGRERTPADKELIDDLSSVRDKYDFNTDLIYDNDKECSIAIYVIKKGEHDDPEQIRILIGTSTIKKDVISGPRSDVRGNAIFVRDPSHT
jgi:hypothetical protein